MLHVSNSAKLILSRDKLIAGGEQHTSLQRPEGGEGTDGIFTGDEDGTA